MQRLSQVGEYPHAMGFEQNTEHAGRLQVQTGGRSARIPFVKKDKVGSMIAKLRTGDVLRRATCGLKPEHWSETPDGDLGSNMLNKNALTTLGGSSSSSSSSSIRLFEDEDRFAEDEYDCRVSLLRSIRPAAGRRLY